MVVVQKFSLPFGLMVITKSEFQKKNSFVHQLYRKLRQPWCCVIMDVSSYKQDWQMLVVNCCESCQCFSWYSIGNLVKNVP